MFMSAASELNADGDGSPPMGSLTRSCFLAGCRAQPRYVTRSTATTPPIAMMETGLDPSSAVRERGPALNGTDGGGGRGEQHGTAWLGWGVGSVGGGVGGDGRSGGVDGDGFV